MNQILNKIQKIINQYKDNKKTMRIIIVLKYIVD
jgi:hypothetical protein